MRDERRAIAVHPRVCGELLAAARLTTHLTGSSPRVRGTPRRGARGLRRERFIPACAGNSYRSSSVSAAAPVHPRVCGELFGGSFIEGARYGSSPRVRGTPAGGAGGGRAVRFIPACAGNSSAPPASKVGKPVHPRVCGELEPLWRLSAAGNGSSPRVRGTRYGARPWRIWPRFIPACAGNSKSKVCMLTLLDGSSPRVRGTHDPRAEWQRRERFIPACAGNSAFRTRWRCRRTVHPRVCGELEVSHRFRVQFHGSSPRVRGTRPARRATAWTPAVHPRVCGELEGVTGRALALGGSSPRVRGTRARDRRGAGRRRFIPACAGNSRPPTCRRPSPPVHPRVCGELPGTITSARLDPGSSPRVRGTPGHRCSPTRRGRFIPACAGNSRSRRTSATSPTVHPRVCG